MDNQELLSARKEVHKFLAFCQNLCASNQKTRQNTAQVRFWAGVSFLDNSFGARENVAHGF